MFSTGASFILIIFILLITSLIYYCKSDKIINKIPKNNLLITVDKGNYYRGLDKVILSHQNTIIREENLNNVTA